MPFQPSYEVPEPRRAYTINGEVEKRGMENGRIGCLILHGFMGSPVSSRDMAQFLAQHGITVHCPLLPGHGNLPYMLHNVSRRDWIAEAEEALAKLRQTVDQIFIMGHSMGAVLGAYLTNKSSDIRGLIMLAPLYDVPDPRIKLAWLGKYFMPWFYPLKHKDADNEIFLGRVKDFNPDIDIHDPSLSDWLMQATRIPLSGVAQMVAMSRLGRRLWPRLNIPVLILQGEEDPAVSPDTSKKILDLIPGSDKWLELFPDTGHELMRTFDPVHKKVWHLVQQFISERVSVRTAASG
ncbi:MAG: alpha/beta fold hydrolase [Anaerolineales bacterium]|nr:alpha/beta fold hydrolase [Anaerolineales bacterium]